MKKKEKISITEQILLTGGTVPPSTEWLIVRIDETTDVKSGFKFARWKANIEKWIDEAGQDITESVIMWAKIPARNTNFTLSEASFYSKEDLSKLEKLRTEAEKERHLKSTKSSQKPLTYLKDLKVGDKIYKPWTFGHSNGRTICTIVKKYRKTITDHRNTKVRKNFVLLKKGFEEFEIPYDDKTTVTLFVKEDLSHVVVRDEIKKMSTKYLLECYQARMYSDEYSSQELLEMKAELNTREHVPNKKERKIIRRQKQSQKNRRTR